MIKVGVQSESVLFPVHASPSLIAFQFEALVVSLSDIRNRELRSFLWGNPLKIERIQCFRTPFFPWKILSECKATYFVAGRSFDDISIDTNFVKVTIGKVSHPQHLTGTAENAFRLGSVQNEVATIWPFCYVIKILDPLFYVIRFKRVVNVRVVCILTACACSIFI